MLALRTWLSAVAFFYPAYWFSLLVVQAGPVFAHVVFLRHKLAMFDAGIVTVRAACHAPDAFSTSLRNADRGSLLLALAIAAVWAAAIAWLLRGRRPAAGLLLAALGLALSSRALPPSVFRQAGWPEMLAAALPGAALMFWGMRWMAAGQAPPILARLAWLAAAFVLPALALQTAVPRFGPSTALWLLLPVLPAMLAAAALPGQRFSPWTPGWRAIASGAAASLLLATALHQINTAMAASRRPAPVTIPAVALSPNYPKQFFQRGVNFTAEGRAGYHPEVAGPMLGRLLPYGVNAIALVPYASQRRGSPEIRQQMGWERAELVEAVAALAHRRGLKVMLKPQVWLHGSYPADIDFDSPADRTAWFANYRGFIENQARLAARIHADIFCVGVEFAKMSVYEKEWREIIASVRRLYPGPLVYGATQGPEFEGIRFWDALDYIGLNNYYPLPDDLSTGEIVRKVETVQRRYGRPVIFPEAGFSSLKAPHRAPWDETPRQLSPEEQARCYEAVLRAFYAKPWFHGIYWWKVGTDGYGGVRDGSHTPWGKPAMEVVKRWYTGGGR